jgi:RNA polymerase sigma-70 factor (ECF subfamily)
MDDPRLEDLFTAFREKGDADALAAVFDRSASELLALALHLTPEPTAAEDLVQATFLAAIQGAESFERGRRVMPWLVGILANQAARARRDRSRQVDPARVEVRAEPDPADASAQREIMATLSRAIDELPEGSREAVRRHVLDGDRAVDIARDTGIAPGTVRMQILRGLDRLRRTLPAGLLAVAPVAIEPSRMSAIRSAVIEAARARAFDLAGTSASAMSAVPASALGIGGALVSWKLGLGAVAALVLAFLALPSVFRSEPLDGLQTADVRDRSAAEPTASEASIVTSKSDLRNVVIVPARESASAFPIGWWLVGDVRDLDGVPANETVIRVGGVVMKDVSIRPDPSGHFVVDVSAVFRQADPPYELIVSAMHPKNRIGSIIVPVSSDAVEAGKHRRVELPAEIHMESYAVLTGTVLLPPGCTDRASVTLFQANTSTSREKWTRMAFATCGKNGAFIMRPRASGEAVLVAFCEGMPPITHEVRLERGGQSDVGVLRLHTGAPVLEGRLSLAFDAGRGGKRVHARRVDGPPEPGDAAHDGWSMGAHDIELREQNARVDELDTFRFHGLPPGTWEFSLALEDSLVLAPPLLRSIPGSDVVIGEGLGRTRIELVSGGVPVKNAVLRTRFGGKDVDWEPDYASRTAVIAPHGDSFEVEVRAPGFESARFVIDSTSSPADVELRIELVPRADESATLVLRFGDGSPLPGTITVKLEPAEWGVETVGKRLTPASGACEVPGLNPGRWSVTVMPGSNAFIGTHGSGFLLDTRFDVDLAPNESHVELLSLRQGGRVRFEIDGFEGSRPRAGAWIPAVLRDATGRPCPAVFEVREAGVLGDSLVGYDDKLPIHTSSRLRSCLPAGDYSIALDDPMWADRPVQFVVKAGEMTTVRVPVARR